METGHPGVVAEQYCFCRTREFSISSKPPIVRLDAELSHAVVLQRSVEGSFQLVESFEAGVGRRRRGGGLVRESRETPESNVVVLRAGSEEELAGRDVVRERRGRCRAEGKGEGKVEAADPVGMAFKGQ